MPLIEENCTVCNKKIMMVYTNPMFGGFPSQLQEYSQTCSPKCHLLSKK